MAAGVRGVGVFPRIVKSSGVPRAGGAGEHPGTGTGLSPFGIPLLHLQGTEGVQSLNEVWRSLLRQELRGVGKTGAAVVPLEKVIPSFPVFPQSPNRASSLPRVGVSLSLFSRLFTPNQDVWSLRELPWGCPVQPGMVGGVQAHGKGGMRRSFQSSQANPFSGIL